MPNYFISDGSTIVNFIIADTKEIAETVTGMTAIQYEDAPEGINIGWVLVDNIWTAPEIP